MISYEFPIDFTIAISRGEAIIRGIFLLIGSLFKIYLHNIILIFSGRFPVSDLRMIAISLWSSCRFVRQKRSELGFLSIMDAMSPASHFAAQGAR